LVVSKRKQQTLNSLLFIGILRIIKGSPIHYYIITGYILVVAATSKKVNSMIKEIMKELNLLEGGAGLTYSYLVTHLKGLTLKMKNL